MCKIRSFNDEIIFYLFWDLKVPKLSNGFIWSEKMTWRLLSLRGLPKDNTLCGSAFPKLGGADKSKESREN